METTLSEIRDTLNRTYDTLSNNGKLILQTSGTTLDTLEAAQHALDSLADQIQTPSTHTLESISGGIHCSVCWADSEDPRLMTDCTGKPTDYQISQYRCSYIPAPKLYQPFQGSWQEWTARGVPCGKIVAYPESLERCSLHLDS